MTPENAAILDQFGLGAGDLVGSGGESHVYALGAARVLRVPRERRANALSKARLKTFLATIAGRLPFATPEIEEIGPGEAYTIEKRLPGRSMSDVLREIDGAQRDKAFRNYAAAIDALSTIRLDLPYGHILAPNAVTAADWQTFARDSLAVFLGRNRATIEREIGDADGLFAKAAGMIADLPTRPERLLVHGDYFPGNVLLDEFLSVSAVIDFGVFTVAGDRQLDLATATLTLELIDECTADDAHFVRSLILERHGEAIAPALRFYRAYLAFSMADPANAVEPYPRLYGWSIAMLKLLAENRLPT